MSYILDAISKAEKQRQTEKVPTLESVMAQSHLKRRKFSLIKVVAVLLVLGILGTGVWFYQPIVNRVYPYAAPVAHKMYNGLRRIKHSVFARIGLTPQENSTPGKSQAQGTATPVNREVELQSLSAEQRNRFSQIRFDVISYSTDDNKRFVMSDNRVLKEGDSVNGFRIISIKPNKIALEVDGKKIKITP